MSVRTAKIKDSTPNVAMYMEQWEFSDNASESLEKCLKVSYEV